MNTTLRTGEYKDGYDAFCDGITLDANPFIDAVGNMIGKFHQWYDWRAGWFDAEMREG